MVSNRFPEDSSEPLPERKGSVSTGDYLYSYEPEPLLDSEQAAKRLKIHPKTLQRLPAKDMFMGSRLEPCGDSGLPTSSA